MKGYLSLGSNLGQRELNLQQALQVLAYKLSIRQISSIYETVPVEVDSSQELYLNLVAEIEWPGTPLELLDLCLSVETQLGRERPYHHAPRIIDIDLLLLEGVSLDSERLKLPHPGLEKRAFVIFPLAELVPNLCLPSGRDIISVKNALSRDEILKVWKMECKVLNVKFC